MPLRDVPPEILLAVAAFATLAALFVLAREALVRAARHRTIRLRRERGAAGEARAESLLTALGYTVVGRQVTARYGLGVDGEAIDVTLRADYVVERDDRRFVAEVKTGRAAPRLDTPATRRQLLEYRIAFDVTGVLLVDAEADAVRTVTFPLPAERGDATGRLAWLAVGVALGLASATAMLRT